MWYKFVREGKAPYTILTLFRSDRENPMGVQGLEIAYEMELPTSKTNYWLLFQLDMEKLNREFGIDIKILKKIRFYE